MTNVLDQKNLKELILNVSVNGINDKSFLDFEKE
jgi:hypothetical protein